MNPKLWLLLFLTLPLGCGNRDDVPNTEGASGADVSAGVVTIEVAIDGQITRTKIDNIQDGTTLETLMRQLEDPRVEIKGSKTSAFVDSIGGMKTSGREGWTFQVDGEFSNQGVGSTILHPPTTVAWRYGDFSPPSP